MCAEEVFQAASLFAKVTCGTSPRGAVWEEPKWDVLSAAGAQFPELNVNARSGYSTDQCQARRRTRSRCVAVTMGATSKTRNSGMPTAGGSVNPVAVQ